jgi:hypothetical protein
MADAEYSGGGATAYPLTWPSGWPRACGRARSAFQCSFAAARDGLMTELRLMGAQYVLLSTNVELRRDGLPYSKAPEPVDPGVAVYFLWRGKQMTFACDRWDRVKDNVRAVGKTIEALRGIERWGASDMMERAFSAFEALPAPEQWWQVLGVSASASAAEIDAAYRAKARAAHPDTGGSDAAMARLNAARDRARLA